MRDQIRRARNHTVELPSSDSDSVHALSATETISASTRPAVVEAETNAEENHSQSLGHHFGKISVLPPGSAPANSSPPSLPGTTHLQLRPTELRWSEVPAFPMHHQQRPPALNDRIETARGHGQSLDPTIQRTLENGLGHDLSDVRVHHDGEADHLSRAVGAHAFTTGSDIFFRSGSYSPRSPGGFHLLAHEAVHTVQQSSGPVAGTPLAEGVRVSDPSDRFERAAEAQASTVTAPSTTPVQRSIHPRRSHSTSTAKTLTIQRDTTQTIDGDRIYYTKTFRTNRERPSKVVATVHPTAVGQRGRTPTPISVLHDPTDPDGANDRATFLGYDGGHILGLSLGGHNISKNVVPMYPGFNRGTWKAVETEIDHDKTWAFSGMTYVVTIDLGYASATRMMPSTLTATGTASHYSPKKKKVVTSTKNYGTKTQPTDIEVTPRATAGQENLYTQTNQSAAAANKIIRDAADFLEHTQKDVAGAQYLRANGHLRPSTRAEYPDDPAERPYEYLDILMFAGKISPMTMGIGWTFSGEQRKLILQANMAKNGGGLQSDDPNDPANQAPYNLAGLSEQGAVGFPEIDHIIPKSLGGSNMFSNARVVSWLLNNKEARVKNISGLVDVTRLALPALPGGLIADKVKVAVPALLMRAVGAINSGELANRIAQAYNITLNIAWRTAIQTELDDMEANGEIAKDAHNGYTVV